MTFRLHRTCSIYGDFEGDLQETRQLALTREPELELLQAAIF